MTSDVVRILQEHMEKAQVAYVASFAGADGSLKNAREVRELEAEALGAALALLDDMLDGLERLAHEHEVMLRRQVLHVVQKP